MLGLEKQILGGLSPVHVDEVSPSKTPRVNQFVADFHFTWQAEKIEHHLHRNNSSCVVIIDSCASDQM